MDWNSYQLLWKPSLRYCIRDVLADNVSGCIGLVLSKYMRACVSAYVWAWYTFLWIYRVRTPLGMFRPLELWAKEPCARLNLDTIAEFLSKPDGTWVYRSLYRLASFGLLQPASRDHASTLELLDEVLIDNKVASRFIRDKEGRSWT